MSTEAFNLLAANHQRFVFPVQASTVSMQNDLLWWIITGISIFFTVLIFALTLIFCFKYRASVHPVAAPAGHNNVLEVGWTIVPAIIVFGIFIVGFVDYMNLATPPGNALEIRVDGKKWVWNYDYGVKDGSPVITDTLYVPINTPVRLTLSSADVIHSFYIPAFRVKKDVVPGRYNKMWFEATKIGTFDVYCTEYCGTLHSEMLSKVVVLSQEDYVAKLKEVGNIYVAKGPDGNQIDVPMETVGAILYKARGCNACHTIDGSKGTGPSWKDVYGAKGHAMHDGSVVEVDETYVKESINYPTRKVTKGYGPVSSMPSYLGQLTDKDIDAIIAYMKTLSVHAPKTAMDALSAPTDSSTDAPIAAPTPAQ